MEELLQVRLERRAAAERDVRVPHDFSSGFAFGLVGYGWFAHASNLRPGAFASSCANMPGDTGLARAGGGLVAALVDVSPIATLASRVAGLDAGVRRLVELARSSPGLTIFLPTNCGVRNWLQVRLVPDRPELDRARAGVRGRCSASRACCANVVRSVRFFGMWFGVVTAVGPFRRAGDVDHHAQPVASRVANERVEVGRAGTPDRRRRLRSPASSARSRPVAVVWITVAPAAAAAARFGQRVG